MESLKSPFELFKKNTGIEIPENIVKCYLGKYGNYKFIRLFKAEIESNSPLLRILISERFAIEILKLIHSYSFEERTTKLFQEIFKYNNYGENLKLETSIEDFIYEEILYSIINDYNYKKNQFEFPLVQKAYENIGSNPNEIKVILILWGHCGGEGGIIVRGKNIGYDIGYAHGKCSQVQFQGKILEYQGFAYEDLEQLHKPIFEKNN